MADFSILLICKFRQYRVVNIVNFVHYEKTLIQFSLNVFTESSKFDDKKAFVITVKVLEPAISGIRDEDATRVQIRHM